MGKYITVFDSTIIKVVTSSDYATPSAQEYSPLALALQDPRCEIELGVGFVTLTSIAKALQLLPEYAERSVMGLTVELGLPASDLHAMVLNMGCERVNRKSERIFYQGRSGVRYNGFRGLRLKDRFYTGP
eukprot:SAG31_NODE_19016_length_614_cov_1.357282_1_plen_130_part_00